LDADSPPHHGRLVQADDLPEPAYRAYIAAFDAAGERSVIADDLRPGANFPAFVDLMRDRERGRNLPEGWVPYSLFWLVRDDEALGHISLRHRLTDALRDFGGHAGYAVHPKHRRHGHATSMLRQMLRIAEDRGMARLLITCDPANIASATVIEKCGGLLDSESWSSQVERQVRRYWLRLGA
jgi:predicted acetyltransferase